MKPMQTRALLFFFSILCTMRAVAEERLSLWIVSYSRTDHVIVGVANLSEKDIRAWSEGFSAGYYMFSFVIETKSGPISIRRTPIAFCVNRPAAITIPAHEIRYYSFDLRDGNWTWSKMLPADQGVKIKAVLKPEEYGAAELKVDLINAESEFAMTLPCKVEQVKRRSATVPKRKAAK